MTTKIEREDWLRKRRKIVNDLFDQRTNSSERAKDSSLNIANIKIIQDANWGSFPSLLVTSGDRSYLFNCPPGTQRSCMTNGIKLLKTQDIFLTRSDFNNYGGIYGLSLTLHDIGAVRMCVHSSPDVDNMFSPTKKFMNYATNFEISTRAYLNDGTYSDPSINVDPIVMNDDGGESLIAYLCTLPDLPGKLDPKKCKELKVPIGPQLSRLKSGQDVELSDGTIVRSIDVCGPTLQGPRFLIIECPTQDHLQWLIKSERLTRYQKMRHSGDDRQVDWVIHITPQNVFESKLYDEWLNGFATDCKHMSAMGGKPELMSRVKVERNRRLLSRIDPEIFPFQTYPEELLSLIDSEKMKVIEDLDHADQELSSFDTKEFEDLDRIVNLQPLDRIAMRPARSLYRLSSQLSLDGLFNHHMVSKQISEIYSDIRKKLDTLPKAEEFEPEVVFLGTGSALPSKYRNVSSTLVNFTFPKEQSILLDCGENSYGQLFRFYGPQRLDEVLKRLKVIYISHHHADHHLGLLEIIHKRHTVTNDKLILLVPKTLSEFIDRLCPEEINHKCIKFFHDEIIKSDQYINDIRSTTDGFIDDIGLVAVDHCPEAYATVIRFKVGHPNMNNFTLSYSGDCRPSENFSVIGKNSDLLIHESTFGDEHINDAICKKHSTSSEAISIGRLMNAKYTVLTHFSQRFSKIPKFTKDFNENVGYAFDFLRLKCPSHYPHLPILKPIFDEIFKESFASVDARLLKEKQQHRIAMSLR